MKSELPLERIETPTTIGVATAVNKRWCVATSATALGTLSPNADAIYRLSSGNTQRRHWTRWEENGKVFFSFVRIQKVVVGQCKMDAQTYSEKCAELEIATIKLSSA